MPFPRDADPGFVARGWTRRRLGGAVLRGVLALAAGFASAWFLFLPDPRRGVMLEFEVQAPAGGLYQLFYTDPGHEVFKGEASAVQQVAPSGRFQTLRFPLPAGARKLRLDPGVGPARVYLARMRLRSGVLIHTFRPAELARLLDPNEQISRAGLRSGLLRLDCHGGDPQLMFRRELPWLLGEFNRNRRRVFLAAVVALAAAFFLLSVLFARWHRQKQLTVQAGMGLLFLPWLFLPLLNVVLPSAFPTPTSVPPGNQTDGTFHRSPPWQRALLRAGLDFEKGFPLRQPLLTLHNSLRVAVLGVSPVDKVVLGREGWLYLAKDLDDELPLAYHRRVAPFTNQELRAWKEVLEENQSALSRRGIAYLFVVAANKETIYPEHLPRWVRPLHPMSRLDQLVRYLENHSRVALVDLRRPLWQGKGSQLLYYRNDTHWNPAGAFLASQEILARARQIGFACEPLVASAYSVSRTTYQGDLSLMLALPGRYQERAIALSPRSPSRVTLVSESSAPFSSKITESAGRNGPRTVMVHDSFGNALMPFLSEQLPRIAYFDRGTPDLLARIDQEQPALFIQEIVERSLCWGIRPILRIE